MSRTMSRRTPISINLDEFNQQIEISNDQIAGLENAIKSLKDNGMNALSGSLSSVQGMFQSLGVELGATPQRLLSVATATTKMVGSMQKLKKLKIADEIKKSFSKGWKEAGTQATNFGNKLEGLGPKIGGLFKDLGANIGTFFKDLPAKFTLLKASMKNTGLQTIALIAKNKKLGLSFAKLEKKLILKNILMGVAKGIMTLFNVVKGVMIALWKLSPFGMIAGAVGLAIVGIRALVDWFNRGTAAGAVFKEENERTAAAMDSLNESIENNRRGHENNVRSAEISRRTNQNLISSLQNLSAEENLSAGQRAQVRNKVEQLNSSMEGLNLTIDEETGLLTESSQALFEQASLYNDVNAARSEAESILGRLNQAQAEATEKQLELEIIAERRKRIEADENLRNRERRDLLQELDDQEQAIIETKNQLTEEIEILGYMHYNVYTQMSQDLQEFTDNVDQLTEEQILSYETLSDAQREVVDQMVERWQLYKERGQEMFQELSTATKMYTYVENESGQMVRKSLRETGATSDEIVEQMIENMRRNRVSTQEWSNNLNYIAENFCAEFAQHLRELGPEAAMYVQDMRNACADLVQELADEWGQAGPDAVNQLAKGMDNESAAVLIPIVEEVTGSMGNTLQENIEREFPDIGRYVPTSVAAGVKETTSEAVDAAENLAKEMQQGYSKINDQNSPSKVYMMFGSYIVKGLCNGIKRLKPQAVLAIQTLARSMQSVYNNANQTYTAIGRNIMNGLNQGLRNGESTVMATAQRIANNIRNTMQRALQINSPSRVMREKIGRYIPEGVAAGIDKYADVAIGSVHKLGNDLIKVDLPSVESMIGIGPSMRSVGAVNNGSTTHDNRVVNNYDRLFEGANIHWHNKQDIRKTMEEIAWATQRERARMW